MGGVKVPENINKSKSESIKETSKNHNRVAIVNVSEKDTSKLDKTQGNTKIELAKFWKNFKNNSGEFIQSSVGKAVKFQDFLKIQYNKKLNAVTRTNLKLSGKAISDRSIKIAQKLKQQNLTERSSRLYKTTISIGNNALNALRKFAQVVLQVLFRLIHWHKFAPKRKIQTNSSSKPLVELHALEISNLKVGRKNHFMRRVKNRFFLHQVHSLFKLLSWKLVLNPITITLILLTGIGLSIYWLLIDLYQNTNFDSNVVLTQNTTIVARNGSELFKIFGVDGKRKEISLQELPDQVKYSVLALEDQYFYYSDDGVSWYNLAGAYYTCLVSQGDECRGASGISQQLVRNLTGDKTRSANSVMQRKAREIIRSIKLNQEKDKDWILEKYLNTVYFGRNAYGIQEASKAYFDKDAKDLNVTQSCYLASLIQSPSVYSEAITNTLSPIRNIVEGRKDLCLKNMASKSLTGPAGVTLLSKNDLKNSLNLNIDTAGFVLEKNIYNYPHFVEFTKQELIKLLAKDLMRKESGLTMAEAKELAEEDLNTGGYTVYTSLDPNLQDKVQKAIEEKAKTSIFDLGANNASAVVLDGPTGQILAMIGSLGYEQQYIQDHYGLSPEQAEKIDGKVNVAITAQQAGSTFKPYVYAAAFQNGKFNPSTVLMDTETTFNNYPPYNPNNYTGKFSGQISMKDALARSLNIPAIKSVYLAAGDEAVKSKNQDRIKDQGVANVIDLVTKMGLEFKVDKPEQCGVQIALGGCDVTLLSHAEAMNTFSQLGKRVPASPFVKICDRNGNDIYNGVRCDGSAGENIPNLKRDFYGQEQVLDQQIAREIIDMMSDVQARVPIFGRGAYKLTLPDRTVAAKTGTSNDIRDVWTVGYTPYRTAVVWVGNTDNSPTRENNTSINSAATIWQSVMQIAVDGTPPDDFASHESLGMVRVGVNPGSGMPYSVADTSGGSSFGQWMTGEQAEKIKQGLIYRYGQSSKGALDLSREDIYGLRTTVLYDSERNLCPVSEFQWAKFNNSMNWQEGVRKQFGAVCGTLVKQPEEKQAETIPNP
ncbi:MAG: hypothetical protein OHK0017_04420 [Patescibacteria group bacterium]